MNEYEKISKQLNEMESIKRAIEDKKPKYPEGNLRVCSVNNGKPLYFWIKKDGGRTYLKTSEHETAVTLAQKDYERKLMKELTKQINTTKRFLKNCDNSNLINIYANANTARKQLINPYFITDKEFIAKWYESIPANTNTYPFEHKIMTERGELVRSKSEKILADKLFHKNIPYVYESEIALPYGRICPDFTVLNVRTRKTIYIEHFGMIDDIEYVKNSLAKKIAKYQDNNLIMGVDWIATFEGADFPFDGKAFDNIIDNYLE